MSLVSVSQWVLALGGVVSALSMLCRRVSVHGVPAFLGLWSCVSGCLIGLWGACVGLGEGRALSSLFELPVYVVGCCAAVHAYGYLRGHAEGREGLFWLFFNGMLASMVWVTAAVGFLEFLVAWELMGVMSFALVAFEYRSKDSAGASWGYLLACQAGGALLMVMHAMGSRPGAWALAAVVLGVLGFGLKIGLPGLHTWLPEAHPAAPAPVSAVMSGAMIALGFYGVLTQVPLPAGTSAARLVAWLLTVCGTVVVVPAVALALSQNNLKRLLAYSSVENMGVASLGLGLGLYGFCCGETLMGVAGLAGASLHLLNHALLKGTLFLGAGSVLRATGTLELDSMGGLLRRLPQTGALFSASAVSLSGLPPFNGFIGEFLIYYAAFLGIRHGAAGHCASAGDLAFLALCAAAALMLALTGGLAAAAYARAIGGAFLGEPRTAAAASAREVAPCMRGAMWALSALSLAVMVASPFLCRALVPPTLAALGLPSCAGEVSQVSGLLSRVSMVSGAFLLVTALVCVARRCLPHGAETPVRPTWDCGYARPDARMEYTSTALVQPLMDYFAPLLRLHRRAQAAEGLFPEHGSVGLHTEDLANALLWRPLHRLTWRVADAVHRLQSGYLHLYVLVMVIALLALLAWGWLDGMSLSSRGGMVK